MKLFEKLRWLPTEMPTPATADVSAKSWVLPTFGGDTPGTSSARSRKLRPFSGRCSTSRCEIVPAIWLRAASRTITGALTVTFVFNPREPERDRHLERRADGERHLPRRIDEAREADDDFVRPDLQVGKAEASLNVRGRFAGEVGVDLPRGDLRAGYHGARRVGHAAADARVVDGFLRSRLERSRDRPRREQRDADRLDDIPESHCLLLSPGPVFPHVEIGEG